MKYILGVDAGNSKTIALVARLNGQIVGWGRSGCGDIYNAGSAQQALQNIDAAIVAALQEANCSAKDIVSAAFSMAGADWPEDFALIEEALKKRQYAKRITVVNDAIGALKAGAVDDWGVAVAIGTGAAIGARSHLGQTWHSSFWQEGGGGRALGLSALRAIYQSELGIAGNTSLTARILAFYQVQTVEQVLHLFTKRDGGRLTSASPLARTVLDAAEEGDATARQIVQAEGTMLGDYALAAARKVGIATTPFPLVLAGSVFRHESEIMTTAMVERINSQCPGITVLRSELEPSAGALVIAREATGGKVDRKIRAKLKLTSPPPGFFAT